jgi:tRNA threonylcarbamoyladenosine biosynthesis protein TsaE
MNLKKYNLINLKDTDALAKTLSTHLKKLPKAIVFLEGELGAGKTTLVQYVLQHLGIQERVKSPSYTLIEPYQIEALKIYHIDLYRLRDEGELEHLGLKDLLNESALFLIEWPEKLKAYVKPDLVIELTLLKDGSRTAVLK